MIENYDRSYWIGASDGKYVMSDNRSTKTWTQWYSIKLGLKDSMFGGNIYTRMGNAFEHPILTTINKDMHLDRQLKIPKYNLRANLDGDYNGIIYEVKTHRGDKPFEITKPYYYQAQAEMFAWKQYLKDSEHHQDWHIREHLEEFKGMYIVSYALDVEEYARIDMYERGEMCVEIDEDRIKFHKIKYDKGFISQYKSRLKKLAKKIREGDAPW